jgi:hypothetical protein
MPAGNHGSSGASSAHSSNNHDLAKELLEAALQHERERSEDALEHERRRNCAGSAAAAIWTHQTAGFLQQMAMKQTEMGEHDLAQSTVGLYMTTTAAGAQYSYAAGEHPAP